MFVDDYNEEDEETEGEYEDEEEGNDVEIGGKSEELACPFCSEDFDVLGLCCHIDADHRMEVKPGVNLTFFAFFSLVFGWFLVNNLLPCGSALVVMITVVVAAAARGSD